MTGHWCSLKRRLLFICLIITGATLHTPVLAIDLHGKVESDSKGVNQAGSTLLVKDGKPLEGGIDQTESLNPSLRVIRKDGARPQPALTGSAKSTVLPAQVEVVQFSGGLQVSGAQSPHATSVQTYQGGRPNPTSGVIPPIWSYGMTPQNGVMTYSPGYESQTLSGAGAITSYSPSSLAATSPTTFVTCTHKGVTSYIPSSSFCSFESSSINSWASAQDAGKGVVSYAPGYGSYTVTSAATLTSFSGVTDYSPGHEVTVIASSQNRSTTPGSMEWVQGNQTSASFAINKGITAYAGNSAFLLPGPLKNKSTLGGVWWSGAPIPTGLSARTEKLPETKALTPNPMLAEVVPPPVQTPLLAKALMMPEVQAQQDPEINWDQWYKRVAKAIFDRWKNYEVGPGTATIRVTVQRNRNLSCQVIGFVPCPDVERNPAAELDFRQCAIKSVTLVSTFEIPEFPVGAAQQEVRFDVEMKRQVGNSGGFQVALQ